MKIESIRIKNFRTIDGDLLIEMNRNVTIVGPNSSGKTNTLKAIEMFFTGFDNKHLYTLEQDLPKKLESGQTSLTGTILLEEGDIKAREIYHDLNGCLEKPKDLTEKIIVYLTFTKSENPLYRIFVGEKFSTNKKYEFNRLQRELITKILESFDCHYIPSAKSINSLYNELLLPYIQRSISEKLQEKIKDIENGLDEISKVIDAQLASVDLGYIKSHFQIPNNSLHNLLTSFDYHISDPVKTEIERKGMGIQSAAIIAAFIWITREEKRSGMASIWLIEEPESYLHPELASSCNKLLKSLAEESHLITTTHSLNFVPQDPKRIIGTKIEGGYSKFFEYDTYAGATKCIRDALGVKFSDFCNLGLLNVFVEGKTDRELFQWVLSKIHIKASTKHSWENLRCAEFLDFCGTSALEGFVKATYEYINKERPVVIVLDGDDAGDKTRKNLQQFLGNKNISFEANKQFVMLPKGFALEGLFPHSWIIEAYSKHPNWFKDYSVDMNNELFSFSLKSNETKDQLREYLKRKAAEEGDEDWANSFCQLFNTIDNALEAHIVRLGVERK